MSNIDFIPFSLQAVKVSFCCSKCEAKVESEIIAVPTPDYGADNDSDSQRENDDYAICGNCGAEYNVTVYASMCGGMIDVDGENMVATETIECTEIPKEPDFEHQEFNDLFHLERLYIDNFRNIKQQEFNFTNHDGLTLLIGSNSSGKSNLIEAICGVFYSLYERYEWRSRRCKAIPNKFEVEYTCGAFKNKIKVDTVSYQAYNNILSNDNPIAMPDLPSRVVAIYSGEENRLKQHYFDPSLKKYRQGSQSKMPSMLFLNKDHWDIALLCLLYSDKRNETSFVSELLGKTTVSDVRIDFIASNIVSLERYNNLLVYHLKTHTNEQGLISIGDIASIIDYDVVELFQSLYIAKTQTKATIRSIDFNFIQEGDNQPALTYQGARNVAIHKYCLQSLSEGQKKLILITAAMEFAGQENSLFLLDEPDAHVHLSNKHKIIDVIKQYTHNRHIIITTHSPTLCRHIENKDSIMMIENGEPKSVGGQIEAAIDLVGDRSAIEIFFSSKHIIFVEGKLDKLYISKAKEILAVQYPNLDFDIYPMGGVDSFRHFGLDKLKPLKGQKIICYIDKDRVNKKTKIEEIASAYNIEGVDSTTKEFSLDNEIKVKFYPFPQEPDGLQTWTIEDFFEKSIIKDLYVTKAMSVKDDLHTYECSSWDNKIRNSCNLKKYLENTYLDSDFPKEAFQRFTVLLDDIQNELDR